MNISKTAIMIDSGCDLPLDIIDKYDIKVLRLKIMYDDGIYADGLDIEAGEIYRRFPAEVPKTSTPNSFEVQEMVESIRKEGYEKIIAITISSGLSGTYNTVASALWEVEGMETYAFDTKNISIGAGMYAIWAAKQLETGASFDEITKGLERKIDDSKVYFYMDTLDYLRKGGRINPAVAIVGKALNLKPIISCNEKGVYYTVAKIRGKVKGLGKIIEVALERAGQGKPCFAVMNGGAPDVAGQVIEVLKENIPDAEIVVNKQITPSMAVHTGPGLIGICVFDKNFEIMQKNHK